MGRPSKHPAQRPPRTWEEAPAVMDVSYAALLLNIAPRTLQQLLQNKKIPGRRIGERKYIIDKEQLHNWVLGVSETAV